MTKNPDHPDILNHSPGAQRTSQLYRINLRLQNRHPDVAPVIQTTFEVDRRGIARPVRHQIGNAVTPSLEEAVRLAQNAERVLQLRTLRGQPHTDRPASNTANTEFPGDWSTFFGDIFGDVTKPRRP